MSNASQSRYRTNQNAQNSNYRPRGNKSVSGASERNNRSAGAGFGTASGGFGKPGWMNGSQGGNSMMNSTTGYPGMLPTLGLTQYKDVDLQQNKKNPFTVQQETEKLLVVREREREFQEFHRLEKEGLRIHEKEKQSRPSRKGVIREIKSIKTSKSTNWDGARGQLVKRSNQNDEAGANQNKKINIFEQ